MKDDYQKYRREQLADGEEFQDFVVDLAWEAGLAIAQYTSKKYQFRAGESRSGIEIKYDKRRRETGNLCIEVAEKSSPREGEYAPSGIMGKGWLYAIGDYSVVYFLPTTILRLFHLATDNFGNPDFRHYQTPTSKGFLLPEVKAAKYAALTLRPATQDTLAA